MKKKIINVKALFENDPFTFNRPDISILIKKREYELNELNEGSFHG